MIILCVVGADSSALTKSIEVLARIETKASDIAKCSYHLALYLGSVSLGTVLNDKEVMLIRNLFYPLEIKRLSVKVNTNDSLSLVCNLFFDLVRIKLPGICRTINKYWLSSCVGYAPG